MSLFTQIRDIVQAPMKSFAAFDPILHKVTTGHFSLSVKAYKDRTAAGVHELYKNDRLAQKLGIKESSVAKVATIAGYVVAAYFTAGSVSGAFSGGTSATTGATTGLTAGEVESGLSIAQALKKAQDQKKAADEAAAQQAAAQQAAVTAQQQAALAQANPPSSGFTVGHLVALLAAAAAIL